MPRHPLSVSSAGHSSPPGCLIPLRAAAVRPGYAGRTLARSGALGEWRGGVLLLGGGDGAGAALPDGAAIVLDLVAGLVADTDGRGLAARAAGLPDIRRVGGGYGRYGRYWGGYGCYGSDRGLDQGGARRGRDLFGGFLGSNRGIQSHSNSSNTP